MHNWTLKFHILALYIYLKPITDFRMPYYDIKMSYPDIIMPYAENKMSNPVISMTILNTMPYCDIILCYSTGLVI